MDYNPENLKLVGYSVLVEILDPEDLVVNGFIVKASAENQEVKGKVLSVGTSSEICVSAGDVVLLSKTNPLEITFNGRKCRLLNDREILATLAKKD